MSQNNPEIIYDPMCECGHRESEHDHTWSDLCMRASCECPSFKHRIINGDQDEDDLNPLEAKADAILQYRQDHIGWDKKEPEQLSEAVCKFVEWIGERMCKDSWFKYDSKNSKWYVHMKGHMTTAELYENFKQLNLTIMATAYTTIERIEFIINSELTICNLFYSSTEQGTPWGGGWKTKTFPKEKSIVDFISEEVTNYLDWDNGKH